MNEHPDVVLVVDDDEDQRRFLQLVLEGAGYRALTAGDAQEGIRLARSGDPRLVILDYGLPDMNGLDTLRHLRVSDPKLPVIFLTGYAELALVVASVKEGAFDYLQKPVDHGFLLGRVRDALLCRRTPDTPSRSLRQRMGSSPAISRTIRDVERVAGTDFAVCLHGETGTGKEVVARGIHAASARSGGPFVAVDCGSIPDTLIENELFGHERGAFTGAERQQPGKLEATQGGTLFLDEIGNLSWSAQARLLRVLQERVLYRVGGTKPVPIDVRLISASNRNLNECVVQGTFREDLLYRLCDYRILIPPLRERREDILHIARGFLAEVNAELCKEVRGFSDAAVQALLDYPWPGNVRQLRSTVRRAVLLASYLIDAHHLALLDLGPDDLGEPRAATGPQALEGRSLKEIVRLRTADVERQVLIGALRHSRGNKAAVARMLQVDYKTVHTKLKAYGLCA